MKTTWQATSRHQSSIVEFYWPPTAPVSLGLLLLSALLLDPSPFCIAREFKLFLLQYYTDATPSPCHISDLSIWSHPHPVSCFITALSSHFPDEDNSLQRLLLCAIIYIYVSFPPFYSKIHNSSYIVAFLTSR